MAAGASESDCRPAASSVDMGELAVAFAGRRDVAGLWERLRTGAEIGDARDLVRVRLADSRAHERAGRFDEAAQAAHSALRLAESIDDQEGIAGGLSHLSYVKYRVHRQEHVPVEPLRRARWWSRAHGRHQALADRRHP